MFYGKCANGNCSNRAKRKYKLLVAWAYAYCGGEVLFDRYCGQECLDKALSKVK